MIDINPMLLCDTYKTTHNRMYNKDLKKLFSYWVPRKSMFKKSENQKMVFFGLQAFIKEYLIEYFNKNFFGKSESEVIKSYTKYLNIQIGEGNYDIEPIVSLHRLGYLPLEIKAIEEGSIVGMNIPCIQVTNTDDNFAWLVQWIECIMQVELWKMCNHATIGNMYCRIANKWYGITVDDDKDPRNAFSDFGMRGMSCIEEATRASSAWLLSSNKTSTIPALFYIDKFYNADCETNGIGRGAVSTEHSVMASNYAIDGDEITFVKRLLTELYPNTSFSMVSDTYDYWNMIDNILPECYREIKQHNGTLFIRPDSGDQVDTVIKTVNKLYSIFGGTINDKGYKVLDDSVRVILGDGSTLSTVNKIYSKLYELRFSAENVIFGVGAFCFSAMFEDDKLIVNTRDTYGVAMKSCHSVVGDKEYQIFKDPKTDKNNLKKSHRGMVVVFEDMFDKWCYIGGLDIEEYNKIDKNAMRTIFKDGKLLIDDTFTEIRNRLAKNNRKI